jgi:hypothetical protein
MDDNWDSDHNNNQRVSSTGRLVLAFRPERAQRTGWGTPPDEPFAVSPTSVYQEDSDTNSISINSNVSIVEYHDKEVQCNFEEGPKKKSQTPSDGSLPTGSRLAILLGCTCMAIFLQALVS